MLAQLNLVFCAVLFASTVGCGSTLVPDESGHGSVDAGADAARDAVTSSTDAEAEAGVLDASGIAAKQIAVGRGHQCAVLSTGAVRCWGAGSSALGYGNKDAIGDDEAPAAAGDVKVGGPATQVCGGFFHSCALLTTGAVRCWGDPPETLGYGKDRAIGDNESPDSAGDVPIGGTVVQISSANMHTCALLSTGTVRCWGWGNSGRLGYANTKDVGKKETPASVGDVNIGGTVTQISAGVHHTCALLSTGNVRCWGRASDGQLGYGNRNDIGDDEVPAAAGDVPVGGTVVQISAGGHHTCALLSTGAVRCWGLGRVLGYGNAKTVGDDETPASAGDVPVGGTVVQISAGGLHTCALLSTGAVRCWGTPPAIGYGNTNTIGDDELPSSAGDVPIGGKVTQVTSGYDSTCAIMSSGQVRCWGSAFFGNLGYLMPGDIGDDETPASVGDIKLF